MKTSWKPLGRSLLLNGQQGLRGGDRALKMMDATADENVKVLHTLVMCGKRQDLRSIASEVGISFRAVQ